MTDWSPSGYLRFADERSRPTKDLIAQIIHINAQQVVDIGCGPGNSTELLQQAFPAARLSGFDNSPAMIAAARARLPGVAFDVRRVEDWVPESGTDLCFSNAVFHWVPGHLAIFDRLVRALPDGGVLAVQVPDNLAEASHVLMGKVAAEGPWAERLARAGRAPLPTVADYYRLLRPLVRHLDIWHTIYNHALDGVAAVIDLVRTTGLKPYLDPLDPDEQVAYLAAYRRELDAAYPKMPDGKVLLSLPRLFIVAVK